jgi:activating signal cointegrator 1
MRDTGVKIMKRGVLKEIGAITVVQPWAEIILRRGKNVENRQRNSHYRGPIAIHASKSKSKEWFSQCPIHIDPESVSFGSVIGFAILVDVITKDQVSKKTKKWFKGKYGLVLANIIPLKKPIEVPGARGVWKLKGRPLRLCLEQLTKAQVRSMRSEITSR